MKLSTNKKYKIDLANQIVDKIKSSKSTAFFQYQGLTAGDISALRAQVVEAGGKIQVVKNTVISKVLNKLNIKPTEDLIGPTAITFCQDDEVAPLKPIDTVNKEKDVTSFKFGIVDGKFVTKSELTALIALPGRQTLIAQFVGGLRNPLSRLVQACKFNQIKLLLTLKAISQKAN